MVSQCEAVDSSCLIYCSRIALVFLSRLWTTLRLFGCWQALNWHVTDARRLWQIHACIPSHVAELSESLRMIGAGDIVDAKTRTPWSTLFPSKTLASQRIRPPRRRPLRKRNKGSPTFIDAGTFDVLIQLLYHFPLICICICSVFVHIQPAAAILVILPEHRVSHRYWHLPTTHTYPFLILYNRLLELTPAWLYFAPFVTSRLGSSSAIQWPGQDFAVLCIK